MGILLLLAAIFVISFLVKLAIDFNRPIPNRPVYTSQPFSLPTMAMLFVMSPISLLTEIKFRPRRQQQPPTSPKQMPDCQGTTSFDPVSIFGFLKKSAISTDGESLRQRGAWLAIAFLKISRGNVALLMKMLGLVLIPVAIKNKARLELTMFSLVKSLNAIEPLLKEKLSELEPEMLEQVKGNLFDGAWDILKILFPQEESCIRTARDIYIRSKDITLTLWSRLRVICIDVNLVKDGTELSFFEKTTLPGAVQAVLLDSLSVSDAQIRNDHNSFLKNGQAYH